MDVILLRTWRRSACAARSSTSRAATCGTTSGPRRLAEPATPARVAELGSARAARAPRGAQTLEHAQEIAETAGKTVLRFEVNAGPSGALFGSVTPTDIADELWRARKIRVDRRKIDLPEPIKRVGRYEVPIDVFPDVRVEVKTLVVPEGGELPPEELSRERGARRARPPSGRGGAEAERGRGRGGRGRRRRARRRAWTRPVAAAPAEPAARRQRPSPRAVEEFARTVPLAGRTRPRKPLVERISGTTSSVRALCEHMFRMPANQRLVAVDGQAPLDRVTRSRSMSNAAIPRSGDSRQPRSPAEPRRRGVRPRRDDALARRDRGRQRGLSSGRATSTARATRGSTGRRSRSTRRASRSTRSRSSTSSTSAASSRTSAAAPRSTSSPRSSPRARTPALRADRPRDGDPPRAHPAGGEIARLGWERPGETATSSTRRSRSSSTSRRSARSEFSHIEALLKESFERITALYESGADVTGVPSGFRDLDRITSGFQAGNLIIVAARPSMGKSALGLGIAANLAVRTQRPGRALHARDVEVRGDAAPHVQRGEGRVAAPAHGQARRRGLAPPDGGLRQARQGADLRGRHGLDHDDGDPLEGPAPEVEASRTSG